MGEQWEGCAQKLWILGREGCPLSHSISSHLPTPQPDLRSPLVHPLPLLSSLHACSLPPDPFSFYMQDFNLIFSMQILTGKSLEIKSPEVSFHSSEI